MRKFNKVLNIVLICLAVAIGIAALVLYIVDKGALKSIIDYVVEIFNKPLPVIGITLGTVLLFVWKLVITTNYGKKRLNEYDSVIASLKDEHEQFVKKANEELAKVKSEKDDLENRLIELCSLSTNKKIKDFGKELEYGKETTNSETKAD